MGKYFIIGGKPEIPKDVLQRGAEELERQAREFDSSLRKKHLEQISEDDNLHHIHGRVIVKVDMLYKNSYQFEDGTTIRLERQYNNFNRRITEPVNAIVISAENIPKDSEILISHNALHETNRINDYKTHFDTEDSERIRYYSLPNDDCFAWKNENGEMKPLKDFEFGLRLFKPYTGTLHGIDPELIPDVLFVTTGKLKGNVCNTLKACDYQIVYQTKEKREKYLIRFRHSDEEDIPREELICINHDLTDKVKKGKILVGYSITDAKELKTWQEH